MTYENCPRCSYGLMERAIKLEIVGGWAEAEKSPLQVKTIQKNVWRCIDCCFEVEVDDGQDSGGKEGR